MENTLIDVQEQVVVAQNEQAQAEVKTESPESEVAKVSEHSEVAPEQVKEVEKPNQSKEDNKKFAEQRKKYEAEKASAIQKAKDDLIAEQFGSSHGIYTEEAYKKALALEKQRQAVQDMTKSGKYTEAQASEIIEARRIADEAKKREADLLEKQQKIERDNKDNLEFLKYFREENDRPFDPEVDKIPQEVLDLVNNGTPLKYAYMEHRLALIREAKKVAQKNESVKEASTGSVKGDGVINADFISEATFEANKHKQRWVMDNLTKITKSRDKW